MFDCEVLRKTALIRNAASFPLTESDVRSVTTLLPIESLPHTVYGTMRTPTKPWSRPFADRSAKIE